MKINLKYTIIGIAILFLLAGCAQEEEIKDEKEYIPEVQALEIKPGLEQEFTVTGDVFAHQISRITAEQRGKVKSIFVKEGNMVSMGQDLISLESFEINSAFNTAGSALGNARIGLQQTQLSSEKSIEAAEILLETAKINLQNTLRQNRTLKKQALETLNASELGVKLSVSSAQTNLDNASKSILPVVQAAVAASDKILGISETYKFSNDSFENNLGAMDKRGKADAERALRDILNGLASYSESFENALTLLITMEDVLQKTLSVLNNSIIGNNYTQIALTTDINSITSKLTLIRTSISTLESTKSALEIAQQESNSGNSQAIINARAIYQSTTSQLEASERNAYKSVESAQNALENARRSAELSRVSAKSSVDSAYGNYDQARISQGKLIIQAPFGGKVVEIPVKIGEETNPGTHIITVEDDSRLQLVTYLSVDDIRKVNLGDEVIINKNGEVTYITSISPSADPITKKYKVEMEHISTTLRPGELIKLTFKTGEKVFDSDRIFVPLPALYILPNEIFVWKLENHKTVKATITVGEIVGDYVEALSGLEIGNEIISEGGRLIEDEGTKVRILNQPTPKLPDEK